MCYIQDPFPLFIFCGKWHSLWFITFGCIFWLTIDHSLSVRWVSAVVLFISNKLQVTFVQVSCLGAFINKNYRQKFRCILCEKLERKTSYNLCWLWCILYVMGLKKTYSVFWEKVLEWRLIFLSDCVANVLRIEWKALQEKRVLVVIVCVVCDDKEVPSWFLAPVVRI